MVLAIEYNFRILVYPENTQSDLYFRIFLSNNSGRKGEPFCDDKRRTTIALLACIAAILDSYCISSQVMHKRRKHGKAKRFLLYCQKKHQDRPILLRESSK
jgi:hypothetical protein